MLVFSLVPLLTRSGAKQLGLALEKFYHPLAQRHSIVSRRHLSDSYLAIAGTLIASCYKITLDQTV